MTERLEADVAIIGGGVAGCAAAVALRQAGMSVILLERRLCGAGASGVNFGGVRQQGRHLSQLALSARSRAIWENLSSFLGEDTEFEATGHIKLARSEADMAELERYAEGAREHGLELTLVGRNAIREEYPWLGQEVIGLSLAPTDGQANPRVVGAAYARLARRLGAGIREHTTVTAAAATPSGFALEAENLLVKSRFLLNTAGAGAGKVAAWFGEDVPLEPLMPNMLVTEPVPYFINRSIGVVGGDVYVRQVRRGNIVFGGGRGWGDAELGFARPKTENSLGGISRTLKVIPQLASAHIIRTWSGVDGQMPDQQPVIGFSATVPNLIHAFGFSGHGFQLGPAVGVVLSELVLQGRSATPLEAFDIRRFAGKTMESAGGEHTEH